MPSTYPSVVATLTNPNAGDHLNSPSHSSIHSAVNNEVVQLETFIGTSSSAVGTLIYDIRAAASNGGGHVQTANKGGTGQTSYIKGDMLVASSTSVLSKLAIGGDTLVLTADSTQASGVKWSSPAAVNVQSFVSNGNWSRPGGFSGTSRTFVELWGAGGSGGAGSVGGIGGGGGGGGYVAGWYNTSILSSVVQIDIGAGGAGVVANSQGNVGGITVFGPGTSMLTAYGGGGGDGTGGAGIHAGGGGAGLFANGPTAVITSVAYGGSAGTGAAAATSGQYVGSAGGGSGGGAGDSAHPNGASALWGGGGGGGAASSVQGTGGTSGAGGAGGNGSVVGGGTGQAGSIPGGGGGGAFGTGATSGAGGNGKAIITTFL